MTRICLGHEGFDCDVSLEGAHRERERCKQCGRQHMLIRQRHLQRVNRKKDARKVDGFSLKGAEKLKTQIESYWAARGKTVQCTLERGSYDNQMRRAPYFVRSNITIGPNGYPAKINTTVGA